MLCGKHFFPWDTLSQLPRLAVDGKLPGPGSRYLKDIGVSDNLQILDVLRTTRQEKGELTMTMLELLQWCHAMASTDPRDKIYGVLGLACDLDMQITT